MAKFTTNASSAIWWLNLQRMHVAPYGGQMILVKKVSQVMDSIPWVSCASGNVFSKMIVKSYFSNMILDDKCVFKSALAAPNRIQAG